MTDEQDRPVDLTDHALEVLPVAAGQTSQRIRRSDHRHALAEKLVIQAAEAGGVGKRSVDENDGWLSHCKLPLSHRSERTRACDVGTATPGGSLSAYVGPT